VLSRFKADKIEIKEILHSLDVKLNWSLVNIPNELKMNSSILIFKRDDFIFQNFTFNCESLLLGKISL
jgi:hypothetical protein